MWANRVLPPSSPENVSWYSSIVGLTSRPRNSPRPTAEMDGVSLSPTRVAWKSPPRPRSPWPKATFVATASNKRTTTNADGTTTRNRRNGMTATSLLLPLYARRWAVDGAGYGLVGTGELAACSGFLFAIQPEPLSRG